MGNRRRRNFRACFNDVIEWLLGPKDLPSEGAQATPRRSAFPCLTCRPWVSKLRSLKKWSGRYGDITGGTLALYITSFMFSTYLYWLDYSHHAKTPGISGFLDSLHSKDFADPAGSLAVIAAICIPLFLTVQFQDWRASSRETASALDVATIMTIFGCAIAAWGTAPAAILSHHLETVGIISIGLPLLCACLASILQRPSPLLVSARLANEEVENRAKAFLSSGKESGHSNLEDPLKTSSTSLATAWANYWKTSLKWNLIALALGLSIACGLWLHSPGWLALGRRAVGVLGLVLTASIMESFYAYSYFSAFVGKVISGWGEVVSRVLLPFMVLSLLCLSDLMLISTSFLLAGAYACWILAPFILVAIRRRRSEMTALVQAGVKRAGDRATVRSQRLAREAERREKATE